MYNQWSQCFMNITLFLFLFLKDTFNSKRANIFLIENIIKDKRLVLQPKKTKKMRRIRGRKLCVCVRERETKRGVCVFACERERFVCVCASEWLESQRRRFLDDLIVGDFKCNVKKFLKKFKIGKFFCSVYIFCLNIFFADVNANLKELEVRTI